MTKFRGRRGGGGREEARGSRQETGSSARDGESVVPCFGIELDGELFPGQRGG